MSKTAFISTVYPGVEEYLNYFFTSLTDQDFKKFDVIILNDGLEECEERLSLYDELNICIVPANGTPAEIRELGIKYLCDNRYKIVIFGDSDDYFAPNRIRELMYCLENSDVALNELTVVDNEKKVIEKHYLSKRLIDGQSISFDYIRNKNCFGLSNTIARVSQLKDICIPKDLIAVDWYIFSCLLISGAKAVFTSKTETFYRKHINNIVNFGKIDEKNLLTCVRAKSIHYNALREKDVEIAKLAEMFASLEKTLLSDKKKLSEYCSRMHSLNLVNPLWWETIQIFERRP
tara:strand:+ start:2333 stop:3202 length:870 start_codon:yes stop_codon:yes gene_type:complete